MTPNAPTNGDEPRRRRAPENRDEAAAFHSQGNVMVLLTISGVVIATLISFKPLTPIIYAAAILPFYYATMRRQAHRWALILSLRWAIALFASILVVGVFAPDRVAASLPLAAGTVGDLRAWVTHTGGSPPAGFLYLIWGMAVVLGASFASAGFLGFVLAAVVVANTAHTALYLLRHGNNIVQTALVAVPLWELSFAVAVVLILIPSGVPLFERYLGDRGVESDRSELRAVMIAGAGLFVLSLVLRIALPGVWRGLLERWTVF